MHIFHLYFLNKDISLDMGLACLNFSVCLDKTHMEGRVSQHFDIGITFCYMLCRMRHFSKKHSI